MGVVEALEDGSVFSCIVRGANFDVTKEDIDRAEPVIREADLMILQMEIPQKINEYAIDKAMECGCKVDVYKRQDQMCPGGELCEETRSLLR